jgi:hypothetical protein
MPDHNYFANLIWTIADLLRGPYRPPQYERVMLPMTVLRRFDCVLAPTKEKVLKEFDRRKGGKLSADALDIVLNNAAGERFHNHSPLDFVKLKGDPDHIERHLVSYIKGFSENARRIFDFFEFENEIERMREANILYLVVSKFADVNLHPTVVKNPEMGLIFENLIRRFNELANETAGDHFTPREVIRLMVNILFINDDELLATPGTVRKLLDPACGTGGMLAEAQNYLREHHSAADHQALNAALDPAVSRFAHLQEQNEDEAELWRGKVQAFRNLYGFLSQIIPYQDSDLEKLYVFLRHLSAKLPRRRKGPFYNFDDDVRLEYYRLQKIAEGSISLREGSARHLDGPSEVGSGVVREQPVALSRLIDIVNERFGTDFNQADQLFFDQIVEAAVSDEGLQQAAAVNPGDKFELVFKNLLETLFVERMDQNEEIFAKFMNDPAFQKVVTSWLAAEAYKRLRGEGESWTSYQKVPRK